MRVCTVGVITQCLEISLPFLHTGGWNRHIGKWNSTTTEVIRQPELEKNSMRQNERLYGRNIKSGRLINRHLWRSSLLTFCLKPILGEVRPPKMEVSPPPCATFFCAVLLSMEHPTWTSRSAIFPQLFSLYCLHYWEDVGCFVFEAIPDKVKGKVK